MDICPSIYLSIISLSLYHLSIYLPTYLSSTYLPIYPSIHLFMILGFELRAYTLSHQPFFVLVFWRTVCLAGLELWSS
jgi:hypothetical protein